MKLHKFLSKLFILALILSASNLFAKEKASDIIMKAMKDELRRNMNNLALEDLERPFFISYTISDSRQLVIESTLGAIIYTEEKPGRNQDVRVMVGDYKRTNENFFDLTSMLKFSMGGGTSVPLDNDYNGIRRGLWIETDNKYKNVAELYPKKIAAIEQQNLPANELALPDFSKADKVSKILPDRNIKFEKDKWEKIAKELSAVFQDYPAIQSSNVSVYMLDADIYYVNSEGSETKRPLSIAAVRAVASTQADDGEQLYDHVLFFKLTPEELPSKNELKTAVKNLADNLISLKNAPVFSDDYSGPVLFEGQAAGEVFSQVMFDATSGLMAVRKPVVAEAQFAMMVNGLTGKSLENKIGKKLISEDLTIKSRPAMKEYKGTKLIGSYEVDAEAVVPDKELALVEDGILKTLVNNRTPIDAIRESNGHQCYTLAGGMISPVIGSGVIEMSSKKTESHKKLKEELIAKAKEEGLEYAFIIKKMESSVAGVEKDVDINSFVAMLSGGGGQSNVSKPIYIYKVDLSSGEEQLVRTANLKGVSMKSMKDILGVSDKQMVYNTFLSLKAMGIDISGLAGGFSSSWILAGSPSSFILPDAILFEELDIKKEDRAFTKKLPVVENPLK